MAQLTERVDAVLSNRRDTGLLRELRSPQISACDFSSNDYLGFARSGPFQTFLSGYLRQNPPTSSGSTGSRLLSGHSEQISSLEQIAARFHNSEQALLFNSGYDANLSLLSCVPGFDDAIVYDELVHASVHDGMRMSRARAQLYPFSHNDVSSLRQAVMQAASKHTGSILVCIETVYSMDGDVAPVRQMLNICSKVQQQLHREVHLVTDDAHGGGLYGPHGEGVVFDTYSSRHPNLLANVVTFGKAFAAHGAFVLTTSNIKKYLINYARPLIYSTALPPHSVATLTAVYEFSGSYQAQAARLKLWKMIEYFEKSTRRHLPLTAMLQHRGISPIHGICIPGNKQCVTVANMLKKKGFDVYAIRSPTVERGKERIRVIIHSHNTEQEINGLISSVTKALDDVKIRARL